MPEETAQTLATKGWGQYKRAGRGAPTRTSLGPAGSGSKGSSDARIEALQGQLSGGMSLQRRAMAQLGAGDISKQEAKDEMAKAMEKIRTAASGIASLDPKNIVGGGVVSKGNRILGSSGRAFHDAIMKNVTGARGSNFDNIIRGIIRPGQNIGGRTIVGDGVTGVDSEFVPYTGQDMTQGYRTAYPLQYLANVLPEQIASKTLWGNLIQSLGGRTKKVKDKIVPTGITQSKAFKDFKNIPGGIIKDFKNMITIGKPGVEEESKVKELSTDIEDIKKNKKEKINSTSFDLLNNQGVIPDNLSAGDFLVSMQILRDLKKGKYGN